MDRTTNLGQKTLLHCTSSPHTLNAEHSRPLIFRLLRTSWAGRSQGCWVDTVPTKLKCYGYYRRSLLSSSNLQLGDRISLVGTLYYCATTRCRQLRPVADFEAQSTHRRLRAVADLTNPTTSRHRRTDSDSEPQSTRRRLHSVADLPAPNTCRRLRCVNDATISWHHVATRRSVSYRVYTCLPPTTTMLCRHREQATPPGYVHMF